MNTGRILCLGLTGLLAGCSLKEIRMGVGFRELRGNWKIYEKEKNILFGRIQRNWKIDDKLEIWERFDFSGGHVSVSQYLTDMKARGSMFSVGAGVSYYLFCENFSFDVGLEGFYADVHSIKGNFFGIRNNITDDIFGWGLNAGVTGEIPIKENISFIVSGGYNFTDSHTNEIGFDADGWYGFAGLKIGLD